VGRHEQYQFSNKIKCSQGIQHTKEASKVNFGNSVQINGIRIISPLNDIPCSLGEGEYGFKGTSFDFKSTFENTEKRILDLWSCIINQSELEE